MITPPKSVASFYSALFKEPIARKIAALVSPSADDIEEVIVTSLDLASDIQAVNELDTAVRALSDGTEYAPVFKFNPMYLPITSKELVSKLELDYDGDLIGVDGFSNPYISINFNLTVGNFSDAVKGSVCFHQFELPKMYDLIKHQVLVS